jgi:hypothetical protein
MESDEIWQIITHLETQGFHITKKQIEEKSLILTLKIPLLSTMLEKPSINGLRVRMHDKLARINNLYGSALQPEHESLEDSFKDMANYAIIGLLVLRGEWDE